MSELRSIHEKLSCRFSPFIEPFEAWEAADQHRMFWKPEKVKVLLLAESHVFTTFDETKRTVALPSNRTSGELSRFVRLVYCLGYGEEQLLNTPIQTPCNAGAWPFWKIFWSCLHRVASHADFAPILRGETSDFAIRMKNKIELLQAMKSQGVWLLDASLAALYRPGGRVPIDNQACFNESWPYIEKLIMNIKPRHIVVVGKGVERVLRDRLHNLGISIHVQPLPSARLTSQEHLVVFQRYYDWTHQI